MVLALLFNTPIAGETTPVRERVVRCKGDDGVGVGRCDHDDDDITLCVDTK